jgi:hypothetical protein
VESGAAIDTARIIAGLERLADSRTGKRKKSRPAKGDHRLYRIKVISAEGTKESLNILVDPGHKRQPEALLERIADQLQVHRDQLEDVVVNWSREQFLTHCRTRSAADLKPPSMRAPGSGPPRRS